MRCNKVKKLLGAYLDGELSERKAKRIQQHLAKCSACAWELKSFQKIDELGRWVAEAGSSHLPRNYWENYPADLHRRLDRAGVSQKADMAGFLNRYSYFPLAFTIYWLKKIAPGLAAAVIIAALIVAVNYVWPDFKRPSAAQPKGQSQVETSEMGKIAIDFYLREHENAVIQASYSTQPARKQIELGYEDVFHYNAVRGLDREWPGETGIFLRAPRHSTYPARREPSQATDIANGHRLSLQEAQEAVSFKIVAPQTLYPGYFLETIRKIEDRECLQLIYTNGISTLSLFEQALRSDEKFHSGDFREYVMYSREDGEPANIIGWNSTEASFTLIGEEDFSHLMRIIRVIQEDYLGKSK